MRGHATRLTLLLAALVAAAGAARADDDGSPVCGRPAVIERVQAMLRRAGRPLLLDPLAGELSGGPGPTVHCAINGHMPTYDTNHHGMQPIDASFVVRYALELRRNGIFLRFE